MFGQDHGFDRIDSVDRFQDIIPMTGYDDYRDYVTRISQGESNVLTDSAVELLVPTTGSTGDVKLIPYTRSLRSSFQRVVNAWICDAVRLWPKAFHGRAYWSVTPPMTTVDSTGVVPVGFDQDTKYLSRFGQLLASRVIVPPPRFSASDTASVITGLTALKLLATKDLSLISVWSPTFLMALLKAIWESPEQYVQALFEGLASPICESEADSRIRMKRDPRRARYVESILQSAQSADAIATKLWPDLTLVSCWADAGSEHYCELLRAQEPTLQIQPKGLLLTEGCVSFPMGNQPGQVPALDSTFLEFLPVEDGSKECQTISEIRTEGCYEVVITTWGGLYRYRTGDIIRVLSRHEQLPRFQFVGRTNRVVDLVGEKVTIESLHDTFEQSLPSLGYPVNYWLLCPITQLPAEYHFVVETKANLTDLHRHVTRRLRTNPQFAVAESLGQMAKLHLHRLPEGFTSMSYNELRSNHGKQLGALKDSSIEYSTEIQQVLTRLATEHVSDSD